LSVRGPFAARQKRGKDRRATSPVNTMADPLDDYIDAAATLLRLSVAPEWKPAIRANLAVTLRLAALVDDFPLPDDAEPAPVFQA
jgi:hypothetical protein